MKLFLLFIAVFELVIIVMILKNRQRYIDMADDWRGKALTAGKNCDYLRGEVWKLQQENSELTVDALHYINEIDRLKGKVLNISMEAQKRSLAADVREVK